MTNKSVLWKDGGEAHDIHTISALLRHSMVGDDEHFEKCIQDALATIRTEEWQNTFTNVTFVHTIKEARTKGLHIETKTTLYAQALELIYYCLSDKLDAYSPELSFDRKLRFVFKSIYGWKMPEETAHAIRVVRNSVMHTGSINGIDDNKLFDEYIRKMGRLVPTFKNQALKSQRFLVITHFWYIMDDIVARILGMKQEEHMSRNGSPPWNSELFGYKHGETDLSQI